MHFEGNSDDTSYPTVLATDIGTINLNAAIEELVGKIEEITDIPFDDINHGNIAEGTIDLSEGISKYTIADKFRHILEMKVKDVNGYYALVNPVSQQEEGSSVIVESDEALTGMPDKYRMVGSTLFLRPAPIAAYVTLTAGLLFKYTRTSYQVLAVDIALGTLVIGIDSVYHPLIAKMGALPYCKLYKPERVPQMERDIMILTKDCLNFYVKRLKNKHRIITLKKINYI